MDDEAAVEWMQQLLNESATALMPQLMETTHKVCPLLTRAVHQHALTANLRPSL